ASLADDAASAWAWLAGSAAYSRALGAVDGLPSDLANAALIPTFRAGRRAWDAMIDRSRGRHVRVDVPADGPPMPGYLLRPAAEGAARPTLVITNGSDGALPALWSAAGAGALARGWNAFVADGPGQQSMLFEHGTAFRPDWEAVLTPVVDALVARPDVDASALLAYGISQAGYWLPRALAFEHRFRAAAADPGVVDVSASWMANLPPRWSSCSTPDRRICSTVTSPRPSRIRTPNGPSPSAPARTGSRTRSTCSPRCAGTSCATWRTGSAPRS